MSDLSPIVKYIKSDIISLVENGNLLGYPIDSLEIEFTDFINSIKLLSNKIDGRCLIMVQSIRSGTIKVGMMAEVQARNIRKGVGS